MDRIRAKSVLFATLAGICGSSAGIFGKIGMGVDGYFGDGRPVTVILVRITDCLGNTDFFFFCLLAQVSYVHLGRFVSVVMVVLANVGVWLMYTKSLQFGPTIGATGISIASNYIFTVRKRP